MKRSLLVPGQQAETSTETPLTQGGSREIFIHMMEQRRLSDTNPTCSVDAERTVSTRTYRLDHVDDLGPLSLGIVPVVWEFCVLHSPFGGRTELAGRLDGTFASNDSSEEGMTTSITRSAVNPSGVP